MLLQVFIIISIFLTLFLLSINTNEKWSNGYSGWPGPIENVSGRYNIPALYGYGDKYEGNYRYKFGLQKNNIYLTMRGYP